MKESPVMQAYSQIVESICKKQNIATSKMLYEEGIICNAVLQEKRDFLYSRLRQRKQEKYNKFILKGMSELLTIAERAGISVVFFKGLTLANEIYSPAEVRLFGDVDILVEKERIEDFIRLMIRNGYKGEKCTILSQIMQQIYVGHLHADPLYKEYEIDGESCVVCVEVHVAFGENSYEFMGTAEKNCRYEGEVLQRLTLCNVQGEKFPIPNNTDMLYILISHMVVHAVVDPLLYLYVNKPFCQGKVIRMLVEIALYIKIKEIDWDLFKRIVESYDAVTQIEFTAKLIYALCQEKTPIGELSYSRSCPRSFRPIDVVCSMLMDVGVDCLLGRGDLKERVDDYMKAKIERDSRKQDPQIKFDGDKMIIPYYRVGKKGVYSIQCYVADNMIVENKCVRSDCEWILLNDDRIRVFRQNFSPLWNTDTYGSIEEEELGTCYEEIDGFQVEDGYIRIPSILGTKNKVFFVIKEIDSVNPFINKTFFTD